MTKSTITRERLEKIKSWRETYGAGSNVMLPAEEAEELARMALAALDSEPVGEVIEVGDALLVEWHKNLEEGAKLYTTPQAPVIPFGLHLDTQKLVTDFCTALAEKLYKAQLKYGYDADWKQDGWPSQCQAHFHQHIAKGDPCDVAAYCAFMWYHGWKTEAAQPAPVVPDDIKLRELFDSWFASDCSFDRSPEASEEDNIAWRESYWYVWQRCRAAMLQELQKSAGEPNNCRSSENVQVVQDVSRCSTKAAPVLDSSPKTAESRCSKSPMWIGVDWAKGFEPGNSPVIPDGCVMVPKEPTKEMIDAGWRHFMGTKNPSSKGTYKAMLAAAPQLPGSEPAAVPGRWIPVSERMPGSQEWVIVFAKWANQQVLCWDDVQNRWTDFEDQCYYADMFSHWMPLPAAPQEVQGE